MYYSSIPSATSSASLSDSSLSVFRSLISSLIHSPKSATSFFKPSIARNKLPRFVIMNLPTFSISSIFFSILTRHSRSSFPAFRYLLNSSPSSSSSSSRILFFPAFFSVSFVFLGVPPGTEHRRFWRVHNEHDLPTLKDKLEKQKTIRKKNLPWTFAFHPF